MRSTFKTLMLAGTAVVALGATGAQAQVVDLTGASTYGTTAPVNAPTAGININLNGEDLTINNTNSTAIGAITDTNATPDGNIIITTSAAADITQTIASVDNGTGNFTVLNTAADGNIAVTITDALTIGDGTTGNLVVNAAANATTADALTLTVGGNTTVAGTTGVTAGANAGGNATAILNVDGASNTFTGLVTITGGAGAATNDASLVLSGASNTFTGGLTLTDGAAGQALLLLDGAVAQTVTGTVAGDGDITVQNAAGATFAGTVTTGSVTIENSAALDSSATFTNTLNSTGAITLGGAGTGANTLNLDSTGQAFTVTGALTGAAAGETNTVNVTGGNTVTLATATAADNNIDVVNVTGSGTTLTTGQNFQAAAVTVGEGATFATTGNTVTSAVTNNGTLQLGGGSVTGNVSGTGLLDVNTTGTVTGQIAQGTADIAAVTLNVAAAGDNSYNVGTTTFSAAGTVAFDNAARTITGNFTNTTDGQGTITVADGTNTTAFVGDLGASTANSLAALTVAGGGANVVTTTGNLFVDAITLNDADTLQFLGTTAQTVSGTITDGILVVGNGTTTTDVTLDGAVSSVVNTTVDGNAALTSNAAFAITGNLLVGDAAAAAEATFNNSVTIGGTTGIDGTALFGNTNATTANTLTGAVTIGANQASTVTLAGHSDVDGGLTVGASNATFLIKKTATFDPTDADGNGTANEATDMILDATGQAFTRTGTLTIGIAEDTDAIDNGSQIQVAVDNNTGAFATGLGDGTIILQDTAFIDLENNTSTAGALNIIVNTKSAASVIGADSTGATAADAILAIDNATATDELGTIKGNIQGAASAATAQDLAESIAPTVDAGAVVGATNFVGSTTGVTNTQLAALRDGSAETGMMAGNISQGLRAWGEVFGATGTQDRRDGVAGFDVDTYGIAVGIDTETLADNWIWGLSFAYADTEVDSDNVNNTETEIDSYQIGIYANYDLDDRTYVSGQLGYVWGENDQTRSNIGGAGLVASGDYDSDTVFARLEAGRSYAVGHSTTLTPKAMLNYQHYSADGYTETGTVGNAGLVVDSEDLNLFEVGVGIDASWDYQQADGSFLQPKIGVGVRHDLIGDEFETTSRFIGGGANFETDGFDPAQTTFNIGADLTYFSTSNWELSAGYDFEVKSDYDAHAGTVRAAYKF